MPDDCHATNTASWLERVAGKTQRHLADRLALEAIHIGRGALETAAFLGASESSARRRVLLVADPDTFDAAGRDVGTILQRRGHTVGEAITQAAPHADDETIDSLLPKLDFHPEWIAAVGSGTISDLGKVLAERAGARLLTVATAASMNGYTSPIAAITVGGLKTTQPSHPADVLIMDLDVIASAPKRLTRAGFGDLMSKPVSGADWLLSSFFFGDEPEPAVLGLVDDAVERARHHAEDIACGDLAGIERLCEALVLSGFSMALAGSSSPASGGEHLISHYRDMSAKGWKRPSFLHGEQVAVGTLCSLEIYRRLEELGAPQGDGSSCRRHREDSATPAHHQLTKSAREAVRLETGAKLALVPGPSARREALAQRWKELWSMLDKQLERGRGLRTDLRRAGCPTSFSEIDTPPPLVKELILHCRWMRRRYTVLDLAGDLGHLEDLAEEVSRGPYSE